MSEPLPAPTPVPDHVIARHQGLARTLLAVALVGLGLYVLDEFLRALVWAVILVVATWPLYRWVQARLPHDRHNLVLPLVFTVLVAVLFLGPFTLLAVQVGHEARSVAGWVTDARANGVKMPELLTRLPVGAAQVSTWWQANLAEPDGARAMLGRLDRTVLMETGRSFGTQLLHRTVLFAFMLVTLFFLYRDGRALRAQMLVAANRLFGPHGEAMGRQIVASIHGTVDGLVLVGLGVGVVLGIGYGIAGVPHPVLLGAATAIGAMFPLGATVVLALAAILLVAAEKALAAAVLFAVGVVVIFAADHFIRPALIGGATRLPFLWVLLGILGGVETFGILGLFLGPAVMAALILLWRDWVSGATRLASPPP